MRGHTIAKAAIWTIVSTALVAPGARANQSHGRDKTAPSTPKVVGPHQTTNPSPSFRFRSSDRDDAPAQLHFRCSFDRPRLHACAARYRQRLSVGTHVLRVRAIDPAGNVSGLTTLPVRITAPTPNGITTIKTGHPLGSIAVGEGAVWVENRDATVTRVDPATNAVIATIRTSYAIPRGFPGWMATGDGSVWISNDSVDDRVNSVTRIDAATNMVVATIAVGAAPTGIVVTPTGVWVANHHGVSLTRIDPATNQVVATVPLRSEPEDLAFAAGSVWLTELDPGQLGYYDLERADAATGAIVARTPVPGHVVFGTDGASLWVDSIDENKIYSVNLATNQLGPWFAARSSPLLAIGLGAVWSAAAGLVRYDPNTGKATRHWLFANSGGLAVGYDSIWVGSAGGLLRIQP